MNILVIGSGAREHSICWSIKKSKNCKKIFCVPGNAGISEIAICKKFDLENKRNILNFCNKEKIDLVIIGPEQFLEDGVSDYLKSKDIAVFGPSKKASKLETSKSFAKKFLKKNNINTADFHEFKSYESAKNFISSASFPIVIKADGLAAGKGVIICKNKEQAKDGLENIMKKKNSARQEIKLLLRSILKDMKSVSLLSLIKILF